jgi:hypothetical protein
MITRGGTEGSVMDLDAGLVPSDGDLLIYVCITQLIQELVVATLKNSKKGRV